MFLLYHRAKQATRCASTEARFHNPNTKKVVCTSSPNSEKNSNPPPNLAPQYWRKEVLASCSRVPVWRSRPCTPTGQLAALACAAHSFFKGEDLSAPVFSRGTKAALPTLVLFWDDGFSVRVQNATKAFVFPAYEPQPSPPLRCQVGHSRSVFVSGMTGRKH